MEKDKVVLGIETSCDETAIAIFSKKNGLIAHELHSQILIHDSYGGIVPELASRDHIQNIMLLIKKVLSRSNLKLSEISHIAYTAGPGLIGSLLVGATCAQTLSWSLNIPSVPINHLEAHLMSCRIFNPIPDFPFTALLVSGGHTQIILVNNVGNYEILGETLDDAAGEAFDKCAKIIGLNYPGGPILSKYARFGNPFKFNFPRPLIYAKNLNFSFSGLKTSVLTQIKTMNFSKESTINKTIQYDLAASIQQAIIDVLVKKSLLALKETGTNNLTVIGGVSANYELRKTLYKKLGKNVFFPKRFLSTDNGIMIAFCALERINLHLDNLKNDHYKIDVNPKWRLGDKFI